MWRWSMSWISWQTRNVLRALSNVESLECVCVGCVWSGVDNSINKSGTARRSKFSEQPLVRQWGVRNRKKAAKTTQTWRVTSSREHWSIDMDENVVSTASLRQCDRCRGRLEKSVCGILNETMFSGCHYILLLVIYNSVVLYYLAKY